MAPAKRPWWRADADTDESDKLVVGLPDDTARWAWFKTMCRAKTQRQMGVFGSEAHLRGLLGPTYAAAVPDMVAAGILHVWPVTRRSCPDLRCKKAYEDVDRRGSLVVHDFRQMQRDPSAADRQARRYETRRDSHGDSHGDSHAIVTTPSRALSPSLSTSSESPESDEPYQVATGRIEEPYATLEELTRWPVQRFEPSAIRTLDGLVDRRGVDAVLAAARSEAPSIDPQPPAPWPLVAAIRNRLEPLPSRASGSGGQGRRAGHHASQEDIDDLRSH